MKKIYDSLEKMEEGKRKRKYYVYKGIEQRELLIGRGF